jgi:predicted DNA-binding transcriptional regulator YafY
MPINKNALIRYQTLDRCFGNPGRRYFIEDLLEEVNNALSEHNPATGGIRRRQLFEDIKFMESENGWSIELDKIVDNKKKYYRYSDHNFSINNTPINEIEAEHIKSALLVLSRFKGAAQFKWVEEIIPKLEQAFGFSGNQQEIISFDSNQYLKGIEYLGTLFNAILYKKVLEITYLSFKTNKPDISVFHPYYLKQYNNRWFLFGQIAGFNTLSVRSLDRVEGIKEIPGNYIENTKYNFSDYFDDLIGITKPKGSKPELIMLHFSIAQAPYILTKPLHGSQKKKNLDESGLTISIEVIPNYELKSLLQSFGKQLKVLSPDWLADEISCL